MEMSLNFELDLADICQSMTSAANRTRCGPLCQLKVVLKLIEILRESFTLALSRPGKLYFILLQKFRVLYNMNLYLLFIV